MVDVCPFCPNKPDQGNGRFIIAAWHHGRPPESMWVCEPCIQNLFAVARNVIELEKRMWGKKGE